MNYGYTYGYQPPPQPQRPSNSGAFWFGCLFLVLVGFIYAHQTGILDFGSERKTKPDIIVEPTDDDSQDQSRDDQAEPIAGTFLVVVSESKGRPVEQVNVLNDHEFWRQWLPAQQIKWYLLDPDDPDAASFIAAAARKNISTPFVLHGRGSTPLSVIAFPSSAAEIKSMILSK